MQVAETVICQGNIPDCSSELEDDIPGVTWLVGFINENFSRVKYEFVPDRNLKPLKQYL